MFLCVDEWVKLSRQPGQNELIKTIRTSTMKIQEINIIRLSFFTSIGSSWQTALYTEARLLISQYFRIILVFFGKFVSVFLRCWSSLCKFVIIDILSIYFIVVFCFFDIGVYLELVKPADVGIVLMFPLFHVPCCCHWNVFKLSVYFPLLVHVILEEEHPASF